MFGAGAAIGGGVDPFLTRMHHVNSLIVAPRRIRNSFTGAFQEKADLPGYFFATDALTLHTNKVIEWTLTGQATDQMFYTQAGQSVWDAVIDAELAMWIDCTVPANQTDDTACWSFSLGSYASTAWPQNKSPNFGGNGGIVHLRQFAKSRNWELFAALGDGTLGTTKTFSLPEGSGLGRPFGGHRVRIVADLRNGTVFAVVDGAVRAMLDRGAGDKVPTQVQPDSSASGGLVNVLIASGAQGAAYLMDSVFSSFHLAIGYTGLDRA